MDLYNKIIKKETSIAIVGMGYVGMPLAVAFSKKAKVIGFDLSKSRIEKYKKGIDLTNEVGDETLKKSSVFFTSDQKDLKNAMFYVVAVPTPINLDKTPDLSYVINASSMIGANLKKGAICVFESTVYPGVTQEACVPALEEASGLKCGVDFKVGYSPERINPGDKVHRLETITKIVSGMDEQSLEVIAKTYELIIQAGVYRAESIKVAEAAKVIENSQRDLNIAFMNELSMLFNKMDIDTQSVLKAAATKWNFLDFRPGLVGGHCIGVDPYYLTYRASLLDYDSKLILSSRTINDSMGNYVAEQTIKKLIHSGIAVKGSRVAIFGVTFKENCSDIRNTKVVDIIRVLQEYGVEVLVIDNIANEEDLESSYGVKLNRYSDIRDVDACIFAVPHDEFKNMDFERLKKWYRRSNVLIDVKGIFNMETAKSKGFSYWRL